MSNNLAMTFKEPIVKAAKAYCDNNTVAQDDYIHGAAYALNMLTPVLLNEYGKYISLLTDGYDKVMNKYLSLISDEWLTQEELIAEFLIAIDWEVTLKSVYDGRAK